MASSQRFDALREKGQRPKHRARRGMHVELAVDALDVRGDRVLRYSKHLGDPAVGAPFREKPHHIDLAGRELGIHGYLPFG